jgi:hypothetical protein
MHAFFGISVDSSAFRSAVMSQALSSGLRDYEQITFFVADRINVYNDVAKIAHDPSLLSHADFGGWSRLDLEERRRWLAKLRSDLGRWPLGQSWRVVGVSDAFDNKTGDIYRGVLILYEVDNAFRRDVNELARGFSLTRRFLAPIDVVRRLSVRYLLEEIAINIRFRVCERILDEYYPGPTMKVLPRLYWGQYIKSAFQLAGLHQDNGADFRFFEWQGAEEGWRQYRDGGWPRDKPKSESTTD